MIDLHRQKPALETEYGNLKDNYWQLDTVSKDA